MILRKTKEEEYKPKQKQYKSYNVIALKDTKKGKKEYVPIEDYLNSFGDLEHSGIKKTWIDGQIETFKRELKKEITDKINIENLTKSKNNEAAEADEYEKIKKLQRLLDKAKKEAQDE